MALFEAKHITATYPSKRKVGDLFTDLSFVLEAGKMYDLVGSSGAGKSTLLRVLALMLDKTAGELYLDGKESASFAPATWRRQVCLVPQVSSLVPGTVRDNILLPWKLKIHQGEVPPTDETLRELFDHAELHDVELNRNASQLSGGQIARVALLRVFATKPRVLLLDEVDAALDKESALAVGRLTNKLIGDDLTCLRIRHRVADGFAVGTFTLREGSLSYTSAAGEHRSAPTNDDFVLKNSDSRSGSAAAEPR